MMNEATCEAFVIIFSLSSKLLKVICFVNPAYNSIIPGIPYITDCVMAELEKLGAKYRVALKKVMDERFERLPSLHKGTYG